MTSKISLAKMLKESLKRNGAMAALLMLVYFVAYPLLLSMEVRDWELWYETNQEWMADSLSWHLAYSEVFWFFTIGFAAILGIIQFAYLHSREKLDFYHSFPVKREKLFGVQYVSGLLTWTVPYVLNLLLAVLLVSVKGYMNGFLLMQTMKSIVIHVICFLVIYSFMILAMMMTGKIFTAILGMGVFMAYVPLVAALIINLCSEYFTTYVTPNLNVEQILLFSPLLACVEVLTRFADPVRNSKYLLLGLLLLACLVTGISMLLYRQRSTESAGHSMAFYRAARVIKFGLVFAATLASQLLFFAIGESMAWSIFGLLFGFVLANAVVEFIYRLDIREVVADKKQILFTLAVMIGVFFIFQFDLIGYDKRLPDRSKVESVSIGFTGQPNYGPNAGMVEHYNLLTTGNNEYVYESQWYHSKKDVAIHNLDAVYSLLEQRRSREEMLENTEYISDLDNVYFTFQMKDGSSVQKHYGFDADVYWQYYEEIWADQQYREQIFPVFSVGAEKMLDITVGTGYYYEGGISVEDGDVSLVTNVEEVSKEYVTEISANALTEDEFSMTRKEKEELYHALREDILGMTVADLQREAKEEGIGFANVVYVDEEGTVCGENFRITKAYENTAALLEEFGYKVPEGN